jgi:hypothetical protein
VPIVPIVDIPNKLVSRVLSSVEDVISNAYGG